MSEISSRVAAAIETAELAWKSANGGDECSAVAVEIAAHAVSLPDFAHPERAFYIFGAEDTGLPSDLIEICDHIVSVPAGSMNLAATVNVILYDRVAKQARAA